jgi:hypothetical protein
VSNATLLTNRIAPRRWLAAAFFWLWQSLRHPWPAIAAGLIGVLLALASWLLPQLPGQFADEHAAAATWLVNTSSNYGIWGSAMLALGLFNVLRSPLLYLLLALLVPTLAAQLADQLGALRQLNGVKRSALDAPASKPGTPIDISAERPLYRWRGIIASPPDRLHTVLAGGKAFVADQITGATVTFPPAEPHDDDPQVATEEHRILALRHPRLHLLRPLLMAGLLLSVLGAWIALAFGWQLTAPPIAPGATFRSANRNFVAHYVVPDENPTSPTLEATLQGVEIVLPATELTGNRVGAATIQARPEYPGLWIASADGNETFALPGESKQRSHIGFVFANPGSEESLLIPAERSGLRVVRRTGSNGFVLELYRSDAVQPVYRAELTPGGQLTIPLAETGGELRVYSLPGLQVNVRALPGLWLVPLGIFLALIGASAFARQSGFALIQTSEWLNNESLVIIQSSHQEIFAEAHSLLAALDAEATTDADQPTQVA